MTSLFNDSCRATCIRSPYFFLSLRTYRYYLTTVVAITPCKMGQNIRLTHIIVLAAFSIGLTFQQSSDNYLMVLGGKGTQLRYVELVSLDPENPLPQCLENMNDLPSSEEFDGSSGATLPDGTPLICGSSGQQCFRDRI